MLGGLIIGYILGTVFGVIFTMWLIGKRLTSLAERGIIMPGENLDKPRSFFKKA